MKRRGWIALLAAPLAFAQRWRNTYEERRAFGDGHAVFIHHEPALNNQCPVCGEIENPVVSEKCVD